MESSLIHNRGRGPELIGSRTTVYHLIPYFLDPTITEAEIASWNGITAEQVAALRAYFLHHYQEVMVEHERIEERNRIEVEAQNAPEFRAKVEAARSDFRWFKQWVDERQSQGLPSPGELGDWEPAFREWLAERQPEAARSA